MSSTIADSQPTTTSPVIPTLDALIDAGASGLKLKNPDNGKVFRVVFVDRNGLSAIKIYDPCASRRAVRSPIMSRENIGNWLSGLVSL